MRPRWPKVLHDLWDSKARTLLVVFSIAVGVFSIGVIAGAYEIISTDMSASYAANHPSNIELRTAGFGEDVLSCIQNTHGVAGAEGRRVFNIRVRVAGTDKWTTLDLVAFEDFDPLGMCNSAPFYLLDQPAYQHIRTSLSKPYGYDRSYFTWFSTSGGFVSTVSDLAKFDIALDQDHLFRPETRELAFNAQTLKSGEQPVYGLGWYVQEYQGTRIAWHQGWDCFSHLYIKFLDQDYTLIIFTNSATLGEFTSSEDVSIMRYSVALAFLQAFHHGPGSGRYGRFGCRGRRNCSPIAGCESVRVW